MVDWNDECLFRMSNKGKIGGYTITIRTEEKLFWISGVRGCYGIDKCAQGTRLDHVTLTVVDRNEQGIHVSCAHVNKRTIYR